MAQVSPWVDSATFMGLPSLPLPTELLNEGYLPSWTPWFSKSLEIEPGLREKKEETGSLVLQVWAVLKQLQTLGFIISRPDEVNEYLLQFPDLLDIIAEIARKVRRQFPEAQLLLNVYRDPEVEDQFLVVYARFNNYGDFVLKKIKEVRRGFHEILSRRKGRLLLTTDFHLIENNEKESSSPRKGSPRALLLAIKEAPHLNAEDVAELEQAIESEKLKGSGESGPK
jgi:hypothetical protein